MTTQTTAEFPALIQGQPLSPAQREAALAWLRENYDPKAKYGATDALSRLHSACEQKNRFRLSYQEGNALVEELPEFKPRPKPIPSKREKLTAKALNVYDVVAIDRRENWVESEEYPGVFTNGSGEVMKNGKIRTLDLGFNQKGRFMIRVFLDGETRYAYHDALMRERFNILRSRKKPDRTVN